jgi:hypothetical protein
LITNGDNDTFPGWILTRIIRFRPDVNIVNLSLLNLDTYASSIVKDGVPTFIARESLDSLKTQVSADVKNAKSGQIPPQDFSVLGDRLALRIIEAGERTGRPVYFACTIDRYGLWKSRVAQARGLGLVTLVTHTSTPYPAQLRKLFTTWISEYRTGGLDSWHLHSARQASAARLLVSNYAAALHGLMHQIEESGSDVQLSLFRWYRTHLVELLDRNFVDKANSMWFSSKAPREIREWSRIKGWQGD